MTRTGSPPAPGAMRGDWDRRAAEDHRLHIATGHSGSEEEFRVSGEKDLDDLVLDGIRLRPEAAALEIGCGVGRLLVPLARRVAEVRGVDISPVMIEKSRAYTAESPNVRTEVTNGTLAGIADASLDLVFSFIVFQHIPSRDAIRAYVAEAARVLKPGGVLRFQVDGRWWWGGGARTPDTYEGVKLAPGEVRALLAGTPLTVADEWGAEGHYHWITARKAGAGAAVDVEVRSWDLVELAAVLGRLGSARPGQDARRIRAGALALRPALFAFVAARTSLDDRAFVEAAFRALLGREGDERGRAYHVEILERGFEDRLALLDTISTSRDFLDLVRPFVPAVPWFAVYDVLERIGARPASPGFFDLVDAVHARLPASPEDAVPAAFRMVLGRAPDGAALAHHSALVTSRANGRRLLVRTLLATLCGADPPAGERSGARGPAESSPGEARRAQRILRAGARGTPEDFVRLAYRRALGREPEPGGRDFYLEKLRSGDLGRAAFLRELLWSDEARAREPRDAFDRVRRALRRALGR